MRNDIINVAASHIGYTEGANNKNQFGEWYGMNNVAWCAQFVSYCYHFAGHSLPKIDTDQGFHYVPTMYHRAKQNKWITNKPQVGDIVLFDWNLDLKHDHTGIFVRWVTPTTFECIEGNTSGDNKGSQSNGGGVHKRVRGVAFATFVNIFDHV